ncbi:ferrous iron transport protein B [bacterium]|nr:ferrous iron transport protein B [bacterium]
MPTSDPIGPISPIGPMGTAVDRPTLHVALVGNPNSGKTSIFNQLTGANQRVANYPGVTVEVTHGRCRRNGLDLQIVDLPGTYSLTANSPEERIARDWLVQNRPDVIVQVIDASNLERSLYLTMQLAELGGRLVIDLNMIDEATQKGIRIDRAGLGEHLRAEVVETVASRGDGIQNLLTTINAAHAREPLDGATLFDFGEDLGRVIGKLSWRLRLAGDSASALPHRWAAIKYAEADAEVRRWLAETVEGGRDIARKTDRELDSLRRRANASIESLIANVRYGKLAAILAETQAQAPSPAPALSTRLDAVFMHKWLGMPLFLLIMAGLFQFVFALGEPLTHGLDWLFHRAAALVQGSMADGPLRSLMVDGLIHGVGGVLIFLPNIVLLFMAIGVLERCGYMARAAFLIDRLMHKIGLHGRSFIPLVTGFGCSVPAIMATRTLEHERDRLATMMVIPLMSCSARLPIYTLLIPAFIPLPWRGPVLLMMYATGIALAVVLVKVLRLTILAGEATPFVMELPPYRMPTLRSVWQDIWSKSALYLRKAGTIILALSILLWAANSYPKKPAYDIDLRPAGLTAAQIDAARRGEDLAHSISGRLGRLMEPAFAPLGFDWRICTALVGAVAAKEVLVAQLGIINAMDDPSSEPGRLQQLLAERYSPLTGVCIMLFALIATPCTSTVAVMRRETNSWKWPLAQFAGLTAIAYVLTFAVYQIGRALGMGV